VERGAKEGAKRQQKHYTAFLHNEQPSTPRFTHCSFFYNPTVQGLYNFALNIWHGQVDDKDDDIKRTSRGMKTRKTVKLGKGNDFTEAIGGAQVNKNKRASKRMTNNGMTKKLQEESQMQKRGSGGRATGPARKSGMFFKGQGNQFGGAKGGGVGGGDIV